MTSADEKPTPLPEDVVALVPMRNVVLFPQVLMPITVGRAKSLAAVRQHAYEMFRDKLPDHPLTLEDWVLAEKDLVNSLEADNLR